MESIYHPSSPSFEDRIFALRSVLKARSDLHSSKAYAKDPKWADALGSSAEIEQAEQTIEQSLSIAATDFQKSELKQALDDGLITDGELRDVMAASHRNEIGDRRSDSSADQNNQSDKMS